MNAKLPLTDTAFGLGHRKGSWASWLGVAFLVFAASTAQALTPPPPPQGRFGCIDKAGRFVIPPIYEHINSCAGPVIAVYQGGLAGFIDDSGQVILPVGVKLQSSPYSAFANGLEPAGDLGNVGYIDKRGVFQIPPQFKSANPFGPNGYAQVFVGDSWQRALIDKSGKIMFKPRTDWFFYFASNGLAVVSVNGMNNFGYLDLSGTIRIPEQFEKAEAFTDNGLAAVKLGGKWGFINGRGDFVIPAKYEEASSFGRGTPPQLARVLLDGREQFIDGHGKVVAALNPGVETWGDFSQGLASARDIATKHKWGYVDERGRLAIDLRLDVAGTFADNGTAEVEVNGKWGYIDKKGQFAIAPQFEGAGPFSANGLAAVQKGGKWGYIDAKGEFAIQPQYDSAMPHGANGLARVEIERPAR